MPYNSTPYNIPKKKSIYRTYIIYRNPTIITCT